MSVRVAAGAFTFGLVLLICCSAARASDEECTSATRKAVVADLTHEGIGGLAKTVGTGLLLIAARDGPAPLRIGSAILFGVEALGLTNTTAQAVQMPLQGDPNQRIRVCHAKGPFANALGFSTLTIISTEPKAADRFQAKIQQEFGAPSGVLHMPALSPTPDTSAQPAQKLDATWDDKAIEMHW